MRSSNLRIVAGCLLCALALVLTVPVASALGQGHFALPLSDRGVDTDGDGLFNLLRVDVRLNVTVGGRFYLSSDLFDATGTTMIDSEFNYTDAVPGLRTVEVDFRTTTIRSSGFDGPYLVELALHDAAFTVLDTYEYTTGTYLRSQFDAPPAAFAPPHDDAGEDRDTPPDGLYNALRVDVRVNVTAPGTYSLTGELWDSPLKTTLIGVDARTLDLAAGNRTVPLTYAGVTISTLGVSGAYFVDLALSAPSIGASTEIFDVGNHTTRVYAASQFQPPLQTVQGRVLDAVTTLPVADALVDAYDYRDGVHLSTQTDAAGDYALGVTSGDWRVVYQEYFHQSTVARVLTPSPPLLPTVMLSPAAERLSAVMHLDFPSWDDERSRLVGVYSYDNATFRLTSDWDLGNRDGFLTMDEYNRSIIPGGGVYDASDWLFLVDATSYTVVPGSFTTEYANVEGPIDSAVSPMTFVNFSYSATLPPAPSRAVRVNVTYREPGYTDALYYVQLPPLYALASFTPQPNVVVTDLGGGLVELDPGPRPGPSGFALVTLIANATDTTPPRITGARAVPDPVELGQPVTIEANVTDDNGVSNVTAWVFRFSPPTSSDDYVMNRTTGDTFRCMFTPSSIGDYGYMIYALDVVGNPPLGILMGSFVVQDTVHPVADAGPDQTAPQHSTVTFNGSGSTDNDRITNYTWTFNDGGAVTLNGVSPTYRFDRAGAFTVTLTVRDPSGNSATDAVLVTVTPTTGTVSGQVTDASGSPLAGATVRLLSGSTVIANTTTNATGAYAFPDVQPGTYSVRAEMAGYDSKSTDPATVAAGQTATLDVALTPTASGAPAWVLPAVIALVVVVAVLGAVAIAMRRRSRKKGTEGPEPKDKEP